ncbi:hypothetical protein HC256_007664 [Beauveria bassiana]|nr:hypothetical protein HC256_007664 [Beauveria bassiana]
MTASCKEEKNESRAGDGIVQQKGVDGTGFGKSIRGESPPENPQQRMELTRLLQGTKSRPELDLERKKRGKGNSLQCVCAREQEDATETGLKKGRRPKITKAKKQKGTGFQAERLERQGSKGKAADKLTRDGRTELVRPCHVSVSVSVRSLHVTLLANSALKDTYFLHSRVAFFFPPPPPCRPGGLGPNRPRTPSGTAPCHFASFVLARG